MGLEQVTTKAAAAVDYDRYRLRNFVDQLGDAEIERRTGTTKLSGVAAAFEANPKAVLFESAGVRPDFVYDAACVAVYVDGPHHDHSDRAARDVAVAGGLVFVAIAAPRKPAEAGGASASSPPGVLILRQSH